MCNTVIPMVNDDVPGVTGPCMPIITLIETGNSFKHESRTNSLRMVSNGDAGDVIIDRNESKRELSENIGSRAGIFMGSNVIVDDLSLLESEHSKHWELNNGLPPLNREGVDAIDTVNSPCSSTCAFPSVNFSNQQTEAIIEINQDDPESALKVLKAKNADRPIIAHLNINFLESKFEPLKSIIKDNIDILFLSETKLDQSYPTVQFEINGYRSIRLDRDKHGGGILFFIRDDLPCKELKSHTLPSDIEGIFIEITIRKTKYLIMGAYSPHKDKISYFLENVSKELDKFLPSYENIMLLGDFNSTISEKDMNEFCEIYNLENLIKGPTCFKNPSNPSSIDVMLTNKKSSFQNSMTLETGLSDFHRMTITVLKRYFKKKDPITINYWDYKYFDGTNLRRKIKG